MTVATKPEHPNSINYIKNIKMRLSKNPFTPSPTSSPRSTFSRGASPQTGPHTFPTAPNDLHPRLPPGMNETRYHTSATSARRRRQRQNVTRQTPWEKEERVEAMEVIYTAVKGRRSGQH